MTALVRSTASLLLNMVKCRFVHQKGLLSMKHIKMILSHSFLSDQFRSNNNIEQMNKPCKNRERNTCQNCKGGKFLKKL